MALFTKKVIDRHTSNPSIPEHHKVTIEKWVDQITSGSLRNQNEIQVQGPFTQKIMCNLLVYRGLVDSEPYTIAREHPVAQGRVNLAIGNFHAEKKQASDTVIAPFELKGADTRNLDAIMPGRHKTPVKQTFEYARDINGAKCVLISNFVELPVKR